MFITCSEFVCATATPLRHFFFNNCNYGRRRRQLRTHELFAFNYKNIRDTALSENFCHTLRRASKCDSSAGRHRPSVSSNSHYCSPWVYLTFSFRGATGGNHSRLLCFALVNVSWMLVIPHLSSVYIFSTQAAVESTDWDCI